MGRIRKTVPRKARPLEVDPKIQKERQRIADHLVRVLREAATVAPSETTALRGGRSATIDAALSA